MNLTKVKNSVYNQPSDFRDYVELLLERDLLESPVTLGIGKLIVDKGVGSLTETQLETFLNYGLSQYTFVENCEMCLTEIQWDQMDLAVDDAYCSECRYRIEKLEKE